MGHNQGSSLFPVGNEDLRKIVPPGNTGENVRTIVGPWEARRGMEESLAAKSSTLELKVVETIELWLESSMRAAGRKRASDLRERSRAMIGLGLPERRRPPRATSGDQHTPRPDYRKIGVDLMC